LSNLKKLASGVGWGTVSVITITVFQLVFMAVMARLLEPADFGLVAIANVSLRFFSYFAQMGIAPALIQKPTLDDGDVRAALALSLGVSTFFFLLALASAGMIQNFFEMQSLGLVVQIMAFNFVIVGFSSVTLGLMRRNTKFKALAIVEIISYVCGYGLVGLSAAYYGAGVWALVAAFMTQTGVTALISYSIARHPIGVRHTSEQRKHFVSFGGRYSLIGFIEFLSSNIDALIIGKLMGATPAGYYNRALLLANLPVQQPANVLTKALFPIMSSMGNQHDKQSTSFQLSTLLIGSYAFAVGIGIYIAAPEIVRVLLGEKWLDAIPILQILAWSVGPLYVSHVAGVTLDSMAMLAIKVRIQFPLLALLMLLLLLSAESGSVANIALAVVATEWVRVVIMSWVLVFLLKIPLTDCFKVALSILLIAFITGFSIWIASQLIVTNMHVFPRLIIAIIAGFIGLVIGFWVIRLIVSKLPAVLFLADRQPRLAKLLVK
jgi:O-antigen/teichoic acid export membrane protein